MASGDDEVFDFAEIAAGTPPGDNTSKRPAPNTKVDGTRLGLNRFVEALVVLVQHQACIVKENGSMMSNSSTAELQVVCVEICKAYRKATPVHVRVASDTPRHLWTLGDTINNIEMEEPRIPPLRVSGITWVGHEKPPRAFEWPESLRRLKFGDDFNKSIDDIPWPTSLQQLALPQRLNQSIRDIEWPRSLLALELGFRFNQPIDNVQWPPSIQRLKLSERFTKPIDNVRWPNSLRHLIFGRRFNRPVDGVRWPDSLQRLCFSGKFNQPIQDAYWPDMLEELIFWYCFNQSIKAVR